MPEQRNEEREEVLASALSYLVDELGIGDDELAGILGVSISVEARLVDGKLPLSHEESYFENGVMLVNIYRELAGIFGLDPYTLGLGCAPKTGNWEVYLLV